MTCTGMGITSVHIEEPTAPCAECARLRSLIAQALAVIRRFPGGCMAKVLEILEQAR